MATQWNQPRRPLAIVNGRLILPDRLVAGQVLVVEGNKIAGLAQVDALGSEVERLDVGGRLVTPGLIDIHIHGAAGHTFNEPSAEAFATITRETARRGITALLATTSTAPIPDLVKSLAFASDWMAGASSAV